MRTLNRYIAGNLLVTVALALGILTFVMFSGHFFRAFDLLARGVSPWVLVKFLAYLLPDMLRFTLPLAMLVATVLVFSRLSADSEVIAMKSMGISIWQIVSPGLALSLLFCLLGLWISLWVSPLLRFRSEQLRWSALAETPLSLLEPGSFVELFPQCSIRIGARKGNDLKDVHIVLSDKAGKQFQDISAAGARLLLRPGEELLELELEDANVTNLNLDTAPTVDSVRHLSAHIIRLPLNYGGSRDKKSLVRKARYMDLKMLCARIALDREEGLDVTEHLLNLHTRLALAISPFSFLLLGVPFGIRSRRSELSIGLLICVLLALGFYAFMMLADALSGVSSIHPQYIIWIPNLLYQGAGLVMLKKLDYKG